MPNTKNAAKAAPLAFIKGHIWSDKRKGHQGEQLFVLFSDERYAILCPYPVVAGERKPRIDRPETWLNCPEADLHGMLVRLTPQLAEAEPQEDEPEAEDAAAE